MNYTLLAQPMDDPTRTRVREGKFDITGANVGGNYVGDFGDPATAKVIAETLIGEPLDVVRERALRAHERRADPYAALVVGVDEPWDVCLLHLFLRLVQASLPRALHDIEAREREGFRERVPRADRDEIERAFAAAAKDPTLVKTLGRLLRDRGVFELYQDRFFALINGR